MNYKAITVNTTSIGAELVADILFEFGGQGVSIIDSADVAELYKNQIIWDYIDKNVLIQSDIVKVTGYTDCEQFDYVSRMLDHRLSELKNSSDFELGSLETSYKDIDGEDWLNNWKKFYSPIELERIVIVPSWLTYDSNRTVVRINPGMAFGTGEHETTRMCLELIEQLDLHNKTVSDIGCGSGILGISCLKLGAKSCYFADIDRVALDNMRENAALNGVLDLSIVECASLMSGNAPRSDVILANITADILIMLAKQLPGKISGGTIIIISGIIKEREQEVLDAFRQAGRLPQARLSVKDWVAIRF